MHLDLNTQRISQINSQLGMDSIYFSMVPFLRKIISSYFSYLHSCFDIALFAKGLLYQGVVLWLVEASMFDEHDCLVEILYHIHV